MSKDWHTPWKISSGLSEHSSSIRIADANGVWVADAKGSHDRTLPCGCEEKVKGFPTDEEAEAIARLIILAPELLREAKALLEGLSVTDYFGGQELEAVIEEIEEKA